MRPHTPPPPYLWAYGPHLRIKLCFPAGEGRTKQEFKAECDINTIMKRYERTGIIDQVNRAEPRYLDVTGYDYDQAMQLIANARSLFNELPASIRERFENDPAQLLDFVHDDENRSEAEDLGLVPKKAGTTPAAAGVVPDSAPAPKPAPAEAPRTTTPEAKAEGKNPPPPK